MIQWQYRDNGRNCNRWHSNQESVLFCGASRLDSETRSPFGLRVGLGPLHQTAGFATGTRSQNRETSRLIRYNQS